MPDTPGGSLRKRFDLELLLYRALTQATREITEAARRDDQAAIETGVARRGRVLAKLKRLHASLSETLGAPYPGVLSKAVEPAMKSHKLAVRAVLRELAALDLEARTGVGRLKDEVREELGRVQARRLLGNRPYQAAARRGALCNRTT
ncbi:MAG: hypothetical protein HYY13_06840 [Nitrospirae bacterium]|nr:hypothetical protein [Nitrospirota bacterium]